MHAAMLVRLEVRRKHLVSCFALFFAAWHLFIRALTLFDV